MKITDEMLAQALAEVMDAMLKSLPNPEDCHHKFSPKFERKMAKLIRKERHYTAYKVLNRVACILLVIALAGSSVLAISVEAREAFFGWVETRFEEFYHYFFAGEKELVDTGETREPEVQNEYSLGWLPDGYNFKAAFERKDGQSLIFSNDLEEILHFMYVYGTTDISKASSLFMFDNECEVRRISVKNGMADLYFPLNSGSTNVIVWADAQNEVIFAVFGYLSELELVKIAENLKVNI